EGDDRADEQRNVEEVLGTGARLQREHHAREEGGHRRHRQGLHADARHLDQGLAPLDLAAEDPLERGADQEDEGARLLGRAEDPAADSFEDGRDQVVTPTRGTRDDRAVAVSYGMVPHRRASSRAGISARPWRPIRTASSPTRARATDVTSTMTWSIVTRPTTGQRRPPTSTSARLERARA